MSPIYVGVGTADSEARNLTLGLPLLTSDPSSPQAGDVYFNTTDNTVKFYDGSSWVSAESGTSGGGGGGGGGGYDYSFAAETHYGDGSSGSGGNVNYRYSGDGVMPSMSLGSNIQNFDMFFECYFSTADQNAQSNDWVICTDGYSDTDGWLLGFYNNNVTNEMSIAYPGGAYGIYPSYGLTADQWNWVKIEWRGGSTYKVWQKSSAGASYQSRVNWSSNVYNGTNWNHCSIGQGRSSSGSGYQSQFYGKIRNFGLNVNSNVANL